MVRPLSTITTSASSHYSDNYHIFCSSFHIQLCTAFTINLQCFSQFPLLQTVYQSTFYWLLVQLCPTPSKAKQDPYKPLQPTNISINLLAFCRHCLIFLLSAIYFWFLCGVELCYIDHVRCEAALFVDSACAWSLPIIHWSLCMLTYNVYLIIPSYLQTSQAKRHDCGHHQHS